MHERIDVWCSCIAGLTVIAKFTHLPPTSFVQTIDHHVHHHLCHCLRLQHHAPLSPMHTCAYFMLIGFALSIPTTSPPHLPLRSADWSGHQIYPRPVCRGLCGSSSCGYIGSRNLVHFRLRTCSVALLLQETSWWIPVPTIYWRGHVYTEYGQPRRRVDSGPRCKHALHRDDKSFS